MNAIGMTRSAANSEDAVKENLTCCDLHGENTRYAVCAVSRGGLLLGWVKVRRRSEEWCWLPVSQTSCQCDGVMSIGGGGRVVRMGHFGVDGVILWRLRW